jgi:hypothetical protein
VKVRTNDGSYSELAMELEGDTVACFMDGAPLFSYTDPSPIEGGSVGLLGAGGLFDDVVVSKL